jgi:hypothetical protein
MYSIECRLLERNAKEAKDYTQNKNARKLYVYRTMPRKAEEYRTEKE